MKLFELFLIEYKIEDISSGKIYRGYVNSQTGKILNLNNDELLHPHVYLVLKHQDLMDIDDHGRSIIPKDVNSPQFHDFIDRYDRIGGDYQHSAYRNHWVRFDVRGGKQRVDFNFSGYAQDVADALLTSFVLLGLKTTLLQNKIALFNLDVTTPGKSGYKSFSHDCYNMTDFNEMKRRFATNFNVKLIESTKDIS